MPFITKRNVMNRVLSLNQSENVRICVIHKDSSNRMELVVPAGKTVLESLKLKIPEYRVDKIKAITILN